MCLQLDKFKKQLLICLIKQAVHEAFHLYHTFRRQCLTSRANTTDKIVKCIMEWMTEDKGGTGIPHFVADNISWWYPVDSKKIYSAMLQRENKSLVSAIMDLVDQMQKMELMFRRFCHNYALINNPQSEVETRIDKFLTGVRKASDMGSAERLPSTGPSPGAQPASGSLCCPQAYPHHPSFLPSTPHTPPLHTALPFTPVEPTHPSTPVPPYTAGPIQPSTPPLLPPPAAPSFASVDKYNHNMH